MPELPEVETIRRDLQFAVLGKGIRSVKIWTPRLVKSDRDEFAEVLKSNRFDRIDRRGKLLIFNLAFGPKTLLIHLKMTGQLICQVAGGMITADPLVDDLPNDHTHVGIYFVDGSVLYFNDMRTFGYLKLCDDAEVPTILAGYGIEPMTRDFTLRNFRRLLKGRSAIVKALLLDQKLIAGIGNIYADEICHKAKIRPDRRINTLTDDEVKSLHQACVKVIKQAVDNRGTTFSNYVDASGQIGGYSPKVYGREGESCLRCKHGTIEKVRVAGRGTSFCPSCQR